ncbi:MAG TPA: glycosyltransferase [Ktedonobacterales bacterium]|nr:glycosyltransferase [Ktedonobacterales bacterium]
MNGTWDTFGELPAITRPMPALIASDRPSIEDGSRWAVWGAARDGARVSLTRGQSVLLGSGMVLGAGLAVTSLRLLGVLLMGAFTAAYLVAGAYKAVLLWHGERATGVLAPDPTAIAAADLPADTVLVPLYHEGAVAPLIVERLLALDYPHDRLQILLLMEANDGETRAALRERILPRHMELVEVPDGKPRTKPRALNVGLALATGDYIVVYDAEDQPDPDQLRKAAVAFRDLPRRVVCLQARLNFYNRRQSILTRLFAMDYAIWYDMLLPGLVSRRALVPLGGTSNHFRADVLRRLGGWDPYNVTEDADIGVRIARARLDVRMLDSTTWEEAVAGVPQWVRQRSRWLKGYFQTYLVHMRHPVALWRDLGPRPFLDFQMLIGGSSFLLRGNPLMWLLTFSYFFVKHTALALLIQALFPTGLYYLALLCLLANFAFLYSQLYVCVRRGYEDLARFTLLGPLYWVLMSVGAWVGLVSLVRDPFYWAKTQHGTSQQRGAEAARRAALLAALRPAGPAALDLSVVIPAYNEVKRLPESLRRLRAYLRKYGALAEVLVVDDGSTDGTARLVQAWQMEWPALRLVESAHRGKGGAIRAGVFAAHGAYIALADADFSMPVEEFERFRPMFAGQYDLAIGTRAAPGAQRLREPRRRKVLSRGFNLLVRLALGLRVRDTQCGFKCLPREVALHLCAYQTIEGRGYDVELLHIAKRRGYRVREVPITWRYAAGSRVRPLRAALAMLRDVWRIRLNSWRGVYRALPEPATVARAPRVAGPMTAAVERMESRDEMALTNKVS